MLSHLKSPNATLTFVPESAIDDDTLTRSNFDDAIAIGSISKKNVTTFKCSAHMNIMGENGQTFPDWIKPKQVVSVASKNFDGFSGVVRFRMMRSNWAREKGRGPDFFIQEGISR